MATTSILALPYPTDANTPDGPTQIKELAEALDVLKYGSRSIKPTIGRKVSSANKVLTGVFQDLTLTGGNLEITPAVASILEVDALFDLSMVPTFESVAQGIIQCGKEGKEFEGSGPAILTGAPEKFIRVPSVTKMIFPLLAGKSYTVKLSALATNAAAVTAFAGCSFIYKLWAS